jgi:signal transduction histidine kinase
MRSLYVRILAALLGTLFISVLAFIAISEYVERNTTERVYDRMDQLQLEEMIELHKSGGREAVAAYLTRLDRVFGNKHYALDANGTDIVTGENRSYLIIQHAHPRSFRGNVNGRLLISRSSDDGRYWFAVEGRPLLPRWAYYPYYYLVLGATAFLTWLTAIGVIKPIRRIAATVDRFGRGDLKARVQTRRLDEIGGLATSFNNMADRLESSLARQKRLLQDIAHELRSPLARLSFAVELARTAQDRNASIDRIKRDIDRLSSLVSELLEMTRVEGDPQSRKTEPIVLNDVVRETVQDCNIEAQMRNCSVEVIGDAQVEIDGDRELLRRAIENVIRNAVRYAPEATKVEVTVFEDSSEVLVTVRDFGPGVPEAKLPHIFEPFFRAEESREAATGGVGLGLSIASRAIQLHQGSIVAENANPGLRVQIMIPIIRSAAVTEIEQTI